VATVFSENSRSTYGRAATVGYFALLVIALHVAFSHLIRLSQWQLSAESNAAVAEGVAWLDGRLDLPAQGPNPANPADRGWDTAVVRRPGETAPHVFNVFPPLLSVMTVVLHPLHHHVLGLPPGTWSPWTLAWLIYWPLVAVAFLGFNARTGDPRWAAFLAFAFIGGTALLPLLIHAGKGLLGQLNQVISQIGILLIAYDVLGRRRIWPGLIGLAIAVFTRQLAIFYAGALLWAAWKRGGARAAAACALGIAAIAGPLLWLNHAKFGHPLDFGYDRIYVDRDDEVALKCKEHGVFSWHFIPENIYYFHLAPPRIDQLSPITLRVSAANDCSTSLWLTTPLALFIFIAFKNWWREPPARIVMLATLPILVGHLCYHSPGWLAQGYNRFAMDFLPVWLVVAAPWTRGGWRTWFTLACTAWSVWYFSQLNVG